MAELPDGTYDCIVVDIEEQADDACRVTFTITAGPRKSETLSLIATALHRDPLDLLGLPATIEVVSGAPVVRW